ncbi:MAG: type II toxin-antitoxin system HicB family antitoxin [Bacillota bacterium]
MRQVIIRPGEDGYWVVECYSLPGCISQGRTKEEAITKLPLIICQAGLSVDEFIKLP